MVKTSVKKIARMLIPSLPNVERTRFQLSKTEMYWFDDEGKKHKIVKAGICANGTRDLCIYWKGPRAGDVSIGKIVDVEKDRILWIPKGDILQLMFEPPLGDRHSLYVDVESSLEIKDMVREMLRRFSNVKGSEYDMYAGKQYLNNENH
jgi:hypothetical protein